MNDTAIPDEAGAALPTLHRLHARRGIKWSAHPADVIPAWIADMDFEVAAPIREFLMDAARASDLGYPPALDTDPLAEIFCERMARCYDWRPEIARVELLSDIVQGLYIALDRYSNPGQGVVIQTPIYPPFLSAAKEVGRPALCNPLRLGAHGFEIDLDGLRDLLIHHDARILMLCNPHNPSGRVLRRDELEGIAELALAHDLVVLADEIHADLTYPGHLHIPFASLGPEVAARTVTFYSATKAFNTAGIRCAVAAFGSKDLQARFTRVPRRVRGGMGVFATAVTRIAWTRCEAWLARTRKRLHANRAHLSTRLAADLPELGYVAPQASYLAWLDCRALDLAPDPAGFFLEHARVALMDGSRFGAPGRGWVRLNFATEPEILDSILDRMRAALDRGPGRRTPVRAKSRPAPPCGGKPKTDRRQRVRR